MGNDEIRNSLESLHEKVDNLDSNQSEIYQTQKCILDRIDEAEDVTEPIKKIAGSAYNKFVYTVGWGVLIGIAMLGYLMLQSLGKLPTFGG